MNLEKYLPITSFKIECVEEGNEDEDSDSIFISFGGTSRSLPYCVLLIQINNIYKIQMRMEMDTLKDIKKNLFQNKEFMCENNENEQLYIQFKLEYINIVSETKIFKTEIKFERNEIVEKELYSFLHP